MNDQIVYVVQLTNLVGTQKEFTEIEVFSSEKEAIYYLEDGCSLLNSKKLIKDGSEISFFWSQDNSKRAQMWPTYLK
jgi:hypothetical protein